MQYRIKIDKNKNIISVEIDNDVRIFARDQKVRFTTEKVLEILKEKEKNINILKVVNHGYCSNISGEPNISKWDFEIENKEDINQKKKHKNNQKNIDSSAEKEELLEPDNK
jgi:hypothetical protein